MHPGADDCLFSKLDLNLLVIFDTVMEERHVTRASHRLGLTQLAVSNALNRLRKMFGDMLFVKTALGVEPTKQAKAIWPEIHAAIGQLQRTIRPEDFDPATASLEYRIAMGDLAAALLTPYLLEGMHRTAPGVSLTFASFEPDQCSELLARGTLDFAVCIEPPRMTVLESTPLWMEDYVVAGRRGHPMLQKPLNTADFCNQPQLSVNQSGALDYVSPVDRALAEQGRVRSISLTVNEFLVAAAVLRDSDLLAVLPRRLVVSSVCQERLSFQSMPFKLQEVTLQLVWHRRSNLRQSMLWFRDRVVEAATAMNDDLLRNKVRLVA